MCGIAGFVNYGCVPADRTILERMTSTLTHRGPDGSGFYVDGPVALGNRRLSIIDVPGGSQPMASEDGAIWTVYNGELYNELELRRELERKGHLYQSTCDTESLVHLYEEHGEGMFSRLNGMFGLAIWDRPARKLVLARDRMGQKPLYYAETPGGGLVFGSEPKALLAHPEVPAALDPAGLARYLFYEYMPAPYSIYRMVRKLRRGSLLVWQDGRVRLGVYWTPGVPAVSGRVVFERAAADFWGAFCDSVSRHRRSDVPIGVFLSGGIDSSSVAAALCRFEPAERVDTFSIGFEDPSFDESAKARGVARFLGTRHHERTFSVQSVYELLPEVASWLDEPFGDASILPTYLLCRFAREHVKVVLGGDGADELLAGYPTFTIHRAAAIYRGLPRPARLLAGAAVQRLPVDPGNLSFDFRLKQFLKGAGEPLALAHQRWLGSFSGAEIDELLIGGAVIDVEREHLDRAAALLPDADPFSRILELYQDTYLQEDILTKIDRASMAQGLEVRAPFLDAELVERVQRMPPSFKLYRGRTKRILRVAAADQLPRSTLAGPKKGFGIPVARWLKGPLRPLLDQLLNPRRLEEQGLFQPRVVARLITQHQQGERDHRKPLWTLLMFQLWYQRWIEREHRGS